MSSIRIVGKTTKHSPLVNQFASFNFLFMNQTTVKSGSFRSTVFYLGHQTITLLPTIYAKSNF